MTIRSKLLLIGLLVMSASICEAQTLQPLKTSPRKPGLPTYWVASEVILGPNIDLAVSVPKGTSLVGQKLQVAEGDEGYGDPKITPWEDCSPTGQCRAGVPILFTPSPNRPLPFDSRDGTYTTYQVQVQPKSMVRFRARFALEIQPEPAHAVAGQPQKRHAK